MKTAALVVATALVPSLAAAQPAAPLPPTPPADAPPSLSPQLVLQQQAAPEPEKENSVNFSPLGLAFGNLALTYEHLWNGTHGLIVEADGSRRSSTDGSSTQMGGGVGYRWHWSGKQNSGFLGVMVAQGFGSGEVTTTSNGVMNRYEMSVRSTTVTGNIGKRWMLTDAVNITFRLGLGWGHYTATAKVNSTEAKDAEKTMNDILAFLPVGFDGELSLGYAF